MSDHPLPETTYLICTTPRTGSTLLCRALGRTRVAGHPDEYFPLADGGLRLYAGKWGAASDAEYVDRVVAATMTQNSVFGAKLHYHHLPVLNALLAAAQPGHRAVGERIAHRFGNVRYIWLRRRNTVAQAISYRRGIYTKNWAQRAGAPKRHDVEASHSLKFNFTEIDYYARLIAQFDRQWEAYFRHFSIAPLVLVYEDFVASYEMTIRRVSEFVGIISNSAAIPPPSLAKQADELSLAWEQKFREIVDSKNIKILR